MKGILWLIVGIIIGTFFGAVLLGWFFDNVFEGFDLMEKIFNIKK